MLTADHSTQHIQLCLDRLRAGDESARAELIRCACDRLERLTRKMLHQWQRVHRWEETADVLQNASLRLYRALADARPASAVDFFRLAALGIRRELADLARHHYGPRGQGAHHATIARRANPQDSPAQDWDPAADRDDPANLAAWAEFHAEVDRLPEPERAVFDLIWYQELSQAEAAELLGISERTVKRRWALARLALHKILGKTLPDGPDA
jgi:RNA polymerase sigma factor (sigma-70 family)